MNHGMESFDEFESTDVSDKRFKWVIGSAIVSNVLLAPALFLFTMYGLMFLPVVVSLGLSIVAFVMVRERCMEAWNSEDKPWLLLGGTIGFGLLFMYGMAWIGVISTNM